MVGVVRLTDLKLKCFTIFFNVAVGAVVQLIMKNLFTKVFESAESSVAAEVVIIVSYIWFIVSFLTLSSCWIGVGIGLHDNTSAMLLITLWTTFLQLLEIMMSMFLLIFYWKDIVALQYSSSHLYWIVMINIFVLITQVYSQFFSVKFFISLRRVAPEKASKITF